MDRPRVPGQSEAALAGPAVDLEVTLPLKR